MNSSYSASSAIAKLNKTSSAPGQLSKQQPGEKKETPQERLKRIMSKQLNKQSIFIPYIYFSRNVLGYL